MGLGTIGLRGRATNRHSNDAVSVGRTLPSAQPPISMNMRPVKNHGEQRECPKCKAMHDIDAIIKGRAWKLTCQCGTLLRLEWERTETQDGPEDAYWFEEEKK